MTNTPANNSAAAAYAAHRADVARLLDVLDMELATHAQAMEADARNWGRVGDLAALRQSLVGALAAFSANTPEAIEAFLAE